MNAAIGGWLVSNPPALELATLALHELSIPGHGFKCRHEICPKWIWSQFPGW